MPMSIGDIIKVIEREGIQDDQRIEFLTLNEFGQRMNRTNKEIYPKFLNGKFGSYRGYYKDLYVGYEINWSVLDCNRSTSTVKDLKNTLHNALKEGVMFGYKGEEFPITMETNVWIASDSSDCSKLHIVGIGKWFDYVVVVLGEGEDMWSKDS